MASAPEGPRADRRKHTQPSAKPLRKADGKPRGKAAAPQDGSPAATSAPVRSPRRRWAWRLFRWGLILSIWALLAVSLVLIWFARDLPRPETALDSARRPSLVLQDRTGATLATYGDLVGDPLRLADMPKCLPAAAVAVEDRRFWSHPGIDPIGVLRAIFVNLTSGRLVQGGSTLTQQVAKNLFLSNARTFRRKVQELMLTVWLEHTFSKKEILEIWLNRVYLGSGTWGVDAAARVYFGASARRLALWQCAALAGIPRAPSRINPRANPKAATARTKEVLAAMADTGAITPAEAAAAEKAIAFTAARTPQAGWFADWVASAAQGVLPPDADATVRTTLDPKLQAVAESRLAALLDGPGAHAEVGQGAVVILDAASGDVRAMVGGRDFRSSPFNRAVLARRQPGSVFKPFVWLNALEKGLRPDDLVMDGPIRIGAWSPHNFDGVFHGEVTLEEALAQSMNTASVRLLRQAGGSRAVIAVARRLGLDDPLPSDLTLALGTGEVGLLDLAAAYAVLFNGGLKVTPTGIESTRIRGRSTPAPHPPRERVVDADLAGLMVRMMTEVVQRGTGKAAAIPGRQVAGKTGTTQDNRDAWFVGSVNTAAGPLVIGIWLGNDDATPMNGVTGSGLPARLFREIATDVR